MVQSAGKSDTQHILDDVRRLVRELRVAAKASESRAGISAAQLFVLERLRVGDLAPVVTYGF